LKPSNRFSPDEGYRMNIENESIKITECRKPEKHGCFPCVNVVLFKLSDFILNAELKMNFIPEQT